jgi:hypothetical protein
MQVVGAYVIPAALSSRINIEVSCPIRAMTGKMSAVYSIISGVISSRDMGFIPRLKNV